MSLRLTDAKALDDLFLGLTFYGTGGGGRAQAGLDMLREAELGFDEVSFTYLDDLPDDALVCATIVIGGRDPAEPLDAATRNAFGLPADDLPMPERFRRSIEALSRHCGRPIAALVPVELGSVATAATMIAARNLGIAILDADGTGRSIPELGMTKLDLAALAPAPLALVDRFGGETLIASAPSAEMADRMARFVSRAVWGRGLACACYPAPLGQLRAGLVAGSITRAAAVGRLLGDTGQTEARLAALIAHTHGRLLMRGVVAQAVWRSEEPYAFRELDYWIDGTGADAGSRAQVWVKNEHHLVWRDGVPVASSPDPIMLLDAATLHPLTTLGDAHAGREVLVLVVPALDAIWREAKGLAVLGPRRFGFDIDPVIIA